MRTVYESNFANVKSTSPNNIWSVQNITISLDSLILDSGISELIQKTYTALYRDRLYKPLDKFCKPKSRSSRSASASASTSAAPHRDHSVHFLDEPEAAFTVPNVRCSDDEYSSDEENYLYKSEISDSDFCNYGTVSSEDSEIDTVLRKEAKKTKERNKNYLPSSSESNDENKRQTMVFREDINSYIDPKSYFYYYQQRQQFYYSASQRNPAKNIGTEIKLSKQNVTKPTKYENDGEETKTSTENSPVLTTQKSQSDEYAEIKPINLPSPTQKDKKSKTKPKGLKANKKREFEEDKNIKNCHTIYTE